MLGVAKEQGAATAFNLSAEQLESYLARLARKLKLQNVTWPQRAHELETAHAQRRAEVVEGVACSLFCQGDDLGDTRHDGGARKVPLEVAKVLRHRDLFLPDGTVSRATGEEKLSVGPIDARLNFIGAFKAGHGRRVAFSTGVGYGVLMVFRFGFGLMVLGSVALFAAGCGPRTLPQPTMDGPGYPTVLTPTSELGPDFAMQQDVTIHHPEGEHSFGAVLQKQGDTLTLMVLGPHGGRAFMLVQQGQEVSFESFIPVEFPFPPQYILHDIHRMWFARLPTEAGEDGGERGGERIHQEMENGRVMTRSFERLDGAPEGTLTARYEGGLGGTPATERPPEVATFDNGWFGYQVVVRTVQWQQL